jgi:hypothetical protein
MDYSKGTRGPREFVPSADVPPDTMGIRWMGGLACDWGNRFLDRGCLIMALGIT